MYQRKLLQVELVGNFPAERLSIENISLANLKHFKKDIHFNELPTKQLITCQFACCGLLGYQKL